MIVDEIEWPDNCPICGKKMIWFEFGEWMLCANEGEVMSNCFGAKLSNDGLTMFFRIIRTADESDPDDRCPAKDFTRILKLRAFQ